MNDELFQAEYRTRMTRSMSDEDLAREMYEAGFKAGREELAADQSRVIEVMQTALEHYANPEVHVYVDGESGRTILDRREDANKATKAIAEAKRIMKGK